MKINVTMMNKNLRTLSPQILPQARLWLNKKTEIALSL